MIRPGLRIEVFEQERVDRLSGGAYQDNTLIVPLPGIGISGPLLGNTIFGGIHRGFTPPSSGALKILNFGEGLEDSGLDLKAEKSWNKELGMRGSASFVNYEITGFHIGIENLVAAGRGTAFKNLGKVNSFGVETSVDFDFSKVSGILPNIGIAYTYLSTEVVDGIIISNIQPVDQEVSIKGKELPYSPNHTLNIGSEFRITPSYLFRIDYKYVSECYTDFQNIEVQDELGITGPIDSYDLVNISGSIKLNEKIKIFLSGKNINDKVYIGSRLHSNPGQKDANISSGILPGARRQINFGLNYSF
jgi:Fe(3+) dicitrate transport protein